MKNQQISEPPRTQLINYSELHLGIHEYGGVGLSLIHCTLIHIYDTLWLYALKEKKIDKT